MKKTALKNGTVLLAQPFMLDSNFRRSAILVCEHNEEGSIGFIMNKPLEITDQFIDPHFQW
ncbi:MAG: YqgE/AlgH family protein, partial [Bacteroidota bacterium]